jgi:hypothetical protein
MAAVTGAIWKCATNNPENVERFKELELLPILIQVIAKIARDRCYDFLNIFAVTFGKKLAFLLKPKPNLKKLIINSGF